MSGYIRGGVQMPYKASPAPQLATTYASPSAAVAVASSINAQYQTYGAYAMQQQQQQQQQLQQQQYAAAYGGVGTAAYAQRLPQTVMDDYERWYTESSPTNRMLLALRSGLDSEVGWALERLCRLSFNEQFTLASIPGLVDALFEWPEWFLDEYAQSDANSAKDNKQKENENQKEKQKGRASVASLFAPTPADERQRRHALEALFVLRNAACGAQNAAELAAHARTRPLLVRALTALELDADDRTQFVLYALELLHALAGTYVLPAPAPRGSSGAGAGSADDDDGLPSPMPALERLAEGSSNRAIIVGALTALTALLGVQQNTAHCTATSPALTACIRYLPLFQDSALVDTCLNFLYVHLSHPPMTRAFLLHPDMPNVVKLLAAYIISQQVEEMTTIDITGPIHTVPVVKVQSIPYELTSEERERIGALAEPERCFEWLRTALVSNPNEELTQVEFWNAYKDHFASFQERHPLLVASEVIKNASVVFPNAAAMVLPGPPQKFIIRGITKREKVIVVENNVCRWNRSQCVPESFKTPAELIAHVQIHTDILRSQSGTQNTSFACTWATCQHTAPSAVALVRHVWTHLPLKNSSLSKAASQPIDPAQLPQITLASVNEQYPVADATQRPPPPPPRTVVAYPAPSGDPSSGALTALLVLRTLFRASFASADAAPRVDADHFGFPGVVEEEEEDLHGSGGETEAEKEGERRGRRAFVGVRCLMEDVRIREPALMGWIHEMVVAGMTGTQS